MYDSVPENTSIIPSSESRHDVTLRSGNAHISDFHLSIPGLCLLLAVQYILCLLSVVWLPARCPFHSHQVILKQLSLPYSKKKKKLPPKVLFVRQNENTVSTQIKVEDVQADGPYMSCFTCGVVEVKISVSSPNLL